MRIKLTSLLFILSIVISLVSLFYAIEDFPIYFFCDEAIQSVKAEQLLNNGLKDENGTFLPLLMRRFDHFNLGITPYINMPGLILFGKYVWVVRATTAIMGLIGIVFIALTARNILKLKNYWAGILFLLATPVFFLHARTGFEMVTATSFYSIFLYFYLSYRNNHPKHLIPAVIASGLAFYSYPGLWSTIVISLIAYGLIDIKYHLKQLKNTLIAVILLIIIFTPITLFILKSPEVIQRELTIYNADVAKNIPLTEKTKKSIINYLTAFNPLVTFIYHPSYNPRHVIKNYGYFSLWSLPLIILGLGYALLKFLKFPTLRIILVSLFTSGLSAGLDGFSPSRNLHMVIPLALLFLLGIKLFEITWKYFDKKTRYTIFLTLSLFSFIVFQIFILTFKSLTEGPVWISDYGLYGMQYGARQLFTKVNEYLDQYPKIMVSPDWANATDVFVPFFIPKEKQSRVKIRTGQDIVKTVLPTDHMLFVVTKEEFQMIKDKPNRFKEIKIIDRIYSPDNKPAFYFLEVKYADDVLKSESEVVL